MVVKIMQEGDNLHFLQSPDHSYSIVAGGFCEIS